MAIVTSDFLEIRDDWAVSKPNYFANESPENRTSLENLQTKARGFDETANLECIRAYSESLNATAELVLVTDRLSASYNDSSLIHGWISGNAGSWSGATMWVCAAYMPRNLFRYCSEEWIRSLRGDWKVRPTDTKFDEDFTIRHCLMGKRPDPKSPSRLCGVHYNFHLLVAIITLTGLDAAIITYVAKLHKDPTLVLLGDAIAHFLEIEAGSNTPSLAVRPQERDESVESIIGLRQGLWPVGAPRWSSAVSKRTWRYSLCLYDFPNKPSVEPLLTTRSLHRFVAGILVGLVMLYAALKDLTNLKMPIDLASLWAYGLGKTNEHSLASTYGLNFVRGSRGRAIQVVLANSFQVMVSFLYLFYNNILTRQVLADEMIRYVRNRKALRVSSPRNLTQRSSYFLSLPWKYAVPQMGLFMVLHWLISQSAFTVQNRGYGPGPNGPRIPGLDGARLGFSAIGIVFSTTLGAILAIALVANSLRPYAIPVPKQFPLMASNSAAIASNCRRPYEDKDAHLYPVQLGVVTHGLSFDGSPDCKGRLTFSSDAEIREPVGNEMYELAQWNLGESSGILRRARNIFRSLMQRREA